MVEREFNLQKNPERLQREFGEMRWTARAKETSASVFLQGRYTPPIQALLEFTDNSVGYRNKKEPRPTIITVIVEKNRINVTDFGGQGTDAEGLKRFALVGETEDIGIGYRGAGAKYAAWYLGEDLEINAKKEGEEVDYSVKIPGFGDLNIEYQGMFSIDPSPTVFPPEKGRFEIIVRRLKLEQLPSGITLARALSEVYRPLLTRKKVDPRKINPIEPRIIVGPNEDVKETNDRIVMFLATRKKKQQVMPLEIPLLSGSEGNLKMAETNAGELIWYWAGEMDLKNKAAKVVKPGMRFYYDGRLLNIDYCGFNEKDPRLASLVGEAHLDNVTGIKSQLTVNKSVGINTQSKQWQRVVEALKRTLAPFVQTLQEKPIVLFEEKPAFLNSAFATARRLVDLSIKDMAQEGLLISLEDLTLLIGETTGQRHAPPFQEGNKLEKTERSKKGIPWSEQKGQTIPDKEADETIKRVRKSFIDSIELRNLDNPRQISLLIKEKDAGSRDRQIVVLNASNPLVSATLAQGELAVIQLVGIQLIETLAENYSTTLEDFQRFRREHLHRFGQYLVTTPTYRKLEIKKLQEKVEGKRKR